MAELADNVAALCRLVLLCRLAAAALTVIWLPQQRGGTGALRFTTLIVKTIFPARSCGSDMFTEVMSC